MDYSGYLHSANRPIRGLLRRRKFAEVERETFPTIPVIIELFGAAIRQFRTGTSNREVFV